MSQPVSGISQSKSIGALDTYSHTALANGPYTVSIILTVQPPSGMNIQLKQNSTVVASAAISSAQQSHIQLQAPMMCTQGDVMSVVLTSSNPNDANPANIKGILNIHTGVL